MSATFENVLYEVRGPLALITLNRPSKRNAISLGTLEELHQAVTLAEHDEAVRVLGDRRDYFESIGRWDERYPLYYEDADLSRTIRRTGRTITQVPDARLVHFVNRSGMSDLETMWSRNRVSKERYYAKWYGPLGRWTTAACRWLATTPRLDESLMEVSRAVGRGMPLTVTKTPSSLPSRWRSRLRALAR